MQREENEINLRRESDDHIDIIVLTLNIVFSSDHQHQMMRLPFPCLRSRPSWTDAWRPTLHNHQGSLII